MRAKMANAKTQRMKKKRGKEKRAEDQRRQRRSALECPLEYAIGSLHKLRLQDVEHFARMLHPARYL